MDQDIIDLANRLDSYTLKDVWGKYPARRYNKRIVKALLRPKQKRYFIRYVTSVFDNPTSTTL
jgi:hypothetical protein